MTSVSQVGKEALGKLISTLNSVWMTSCWRRPRPGAMT